MSQVSWYDGWTVQGGNGGKEGEVAKIEKQIWIVSLPVSIALEHGWSLPGGCGLVYYTASVHSW